MNDCTKHDARSNPKQIGDSHTLDFPDAETLAEILQEVRATPVFDEQHHPHDFSD